MKTALGGPIGWLLVLLSVSVLTITFERLRFWWLWWKRREVYRNQWMESLRQGGNSPLIWMEDQDLDMRFGQPFLEASSIIAPLLGLIGTVLGLSRLLSAMGPEMILPAGSRWNGFGDILISTAFGLVISLGATVTLQLNNGLRQSLMARWQRDLRRQSGSASGS